MKYKTWFFFLGLFWLICLYLFYSAFSQARTNAIRELNVRQMLHARQAAKGIEKTFDHWIRVLDTLAGNDAIVDLDNEGLRLMKYLYATHAEELNGIVRVGPNGDLLAVAPQDDDAIGLNISGMPHFQKAKSTGDPTVSEVLDSPRGFQTVAVHVPVMKNGTFEGVLAAALDFKIIAREYLSEIRLGETGYAWMTSREGIELYCPVPGHTGRSVYENCRDFPSILTMAEDMLAGKRGETTYTFNRIRENKIQEIKKHAVFMPIRIGDTFWSIVVASSEQEILATLTHFRNHLIFLFIVLMVGGLLLAWFGAKAWGIIREEGKRRLAEEALRESESKYRNLFEGSWDGIVMVDESGRFIDANQSYCDMLGYTVEELRAMDSFLEVTPEKWRTWHMEEIWNRRLMNDGYSGIYEKEYTRKDGEVFPVELQSYTVSDSSGKPKYLWGVARDITDRKKAEKERKKLQAQLHQAQKMEAVGTLAGGVAHDFNNLLQAINGYTQILLMDKTSDGPDYSRLKSIQKAVERAANLVRQLLLFSRKVETKRKPIDLNREIEHVRGMLSRTIPKMIDIEARLDSRLWKVDADAVQIEQILLNLGANAADAMPDGGTLVMTTENIRLDDEAGLSHPELESGQYTLLTVSDNGHGMDNETVAHIFEPFFTTKEIGKGTGLGLASVYGIIKSHGGHITCDSEIGRGTTFKIYLPAIERTAIDTEKDIEIEPPRRGTETILLVDDEEPIREFASQVLKKFGYTVFTASSGEEALEIYSAGPDGIDLVIMDIGMPGMGGHRCLRELIENDPAVKVLIASGYSVDERITETLKAGAAGYFGKPYQLNDLLNKVRTVLDRSSKPLKKAGLPGGSL